MERSAIEPEHEVPAALVGSVVALVLERHEYLLGAAPKEAGEGETARSR